MWLNKSIHLWKQAAPWVFFAMLATILFLTRNIYNLNLDEGMLWSSAMKVAEGHVMYREFFEFWTPGSVYILGALFKIFGPHIWVGHTLYMVTSFTCYVLLFLSLRNAKAGMFTSILSVAVFAFAGINFLALSHHWLGLACLLGTLYLVQKSFAEPGRKYKLLVASGALTGITAVIMQYEGAMAVAAGLASILMFEKPKSRMKSIVLYLLPIAILGAAILVIFASQQAFHQLIYSTILFPFLQYRQTNYGLPSTILHLQSTILFFVSLWYLRLKIIHNKSLAILMIFALSTWIFSLFTSFSILHTYAFNCLINSLIILTVVTFIKDKFSGFQHRSDISWYASNVFQSLSIPRVLKIASYSTIGALVIININRGLYELGPLIQRNFSIEREEVALPAGKVKISNELADRIQKITGIIGTETSPQADVYFGPYSSYYYLLFQRPNPIPYSQLTPNYNPEWMFQDAIATLEETKPQYIVWLPRESFFPSGRDNSLYQYIDQNYEIVSELKEIHSTFTRDMSKEPPDAIWQRKL